MGWATFWAIFSQTHLVTLVNTLAVADRCYVLLSTSKLPTVKVSRTKINDRKLTLCCLLTPAVGCMVGSVL
jgi:hypothetical protein